MTIKVVNNVFCVFSESNYSYLSYYSHFEINVILTPIWPILTPVWPIWGPKWPSWGLKVCFSCSPSQTIPIWAINHILQKKKIFGPHFDPIWAILDQNRYLMGVMLAWYYHFKCYGAGKHRKQLNYHIRAQNSVHNGPIVAERSQNQWKSVKISDFGQNRYFLGVIVAWYYHVQEL